MIDPAPTDGTISEDDRKRIEAALAASLVLIYAGKRAQALAQLGQVADTIGLSAEAHDKILAFASERAQLIQDGVNERMDGADDPEEAAAGIDQHNQDILMPFMGLWAANQGVVSALRDTPGSEPDTTAADQQMCNWVQHSSYPDDCAAAMDASPDTAENLIAIAGGEPQTVHDGCLCELVLA